MADFVIVVVALAAVAAGDAVPSRLPTLGFKLYPGLDACEEAATRNEPSPGTRLVCLPVETMGPLLDAH
ncbi:hypothetical protein JMJ55_07540 [Belnapia sp. T6]|uniref:Secreted protein n=1 Tax=Belnapia mucosa TaxID=2804532 RepID=A0ABS1V0E4_9PROT|nr:hypothetical protein [Belnapia mucosa]MBL6455173.1 hypothetical protein [Belnapia mucosa]